MKFFPESLRFLCFHCQGKGFCARFFQRRKEASACNSRPANQRAGYANPLRWPGLSACRRAFERCHTRALIWAAVQEFIKHTRRRTPHCSQYTHKTVAYDKFFKQQPSNFQLREIWPRTVLQCEHELMAVANCMFPAARLLLQKNSRQLNLP